MLSFAPSRPILIAVVAAVALALVGGVYVKGRSDGARLAEADAAKNAIKRIHELEKNNAAFNRLDDRGRCLVFMRDSGLPEDGCN